MIEIHFTCSTQKPCPRMHQPDSWLLDVGTAEDSHWIRKTRELLIFNLTFINHELNNNLLAWIIYVFANIHKQKWKPNNEYIPITPPLPHACSHPQPYPSIITLNQIQSLYFWTTDILNNTKNTTDQRHPNNSITNQTVIWLYQRYCPSERLI